MSGCVCRYMCVCVNMSESARTTKRTILQQTDLIENTKAKQLCWIRVVDGDGMGWVGDNGDGHVLSDKV